ncbi:hypothetical protein IGI04_040270 [Brassica rapa subsp. trilocularis]|uniref:Trehalose-6-phosphate synthase n=1 Tax=Brassica rapa subsp. trilocularis TaxID=1813537 RepID=A0ABQ7KQX2_BRACM|nr:hypothetical protein IGI04_040270 [Brassica rapa subsp. trilocularis]
MEVLYVGSLSRDVDSHEQEHAAQILLEKFKCVPTFLPPDLRSKYYDRFCKRQLWSLFHYMLPFSPSNGGIFDRSMWEAYVAANKLFFQKVIKVINPDDDFVWIHDYHLMVLPTFLRRRFNRIRMGFFLHSPFPSSEIYRSLPIREEILKVLLNSDLIGFHTFDYARHFLTCCSRILGLEYQSKRGYIGLEYYGRTVKIMPVGIDMGRIQSVMIDSEEEGKVMELRRRYEGKTVLLGIDDMDIFRGINLKLLAMEQMLKQHSTWRGRAVLVQIVNLARDKGIDIEKTRGEIEETCRKINEEFGYHQPIVYIDTPISITEINAYYHIAECVVITAVRDGMNLTPYEYIVCRQGAKKSVLVASEFIGCSPSLSRAIRVNPWNVEATGEALNEALSMSDGEKQLRHKKHYRYSLSSLPSPFRVITGLELHWMGDEPAGTKEAENSAIWCMTSRHTRRNAQGEFVTFTNQELARLERTNRQQPRQTETTMGDHANQDDLAAAMALMQQQMQQMQQTIQAQQDAAEQAALARQEQQAQTVPEQPSRTLFVTLVLV